MWFTFSKKSSKHTLATFNEREHDLQSFLFDAMAAHDYENVFFCQEKALGLKAIIAIHDTTLGPHSHAP